MLVADAGRQRGPPLFSVWDLEIGGGGARRQQPLATAGRRAAFRCARVRREPIETAGRGVAAACVRSGISGWVIGLLIGWRAGAERRAANAGRRCWPTARPAAVFCLGLGDRRWRSSSATAARNSWPQGSLQMCSRSARADRNRWPRGGCGVCALWHFRLGDRALDRLACGRRTARGQCSLRRLWCRSLAVSEILFQPLASNRRST